MSTTERGRRDAQGPALAGLLATTGRGVARAVRDGVGWRVDRGLAHAVVNAVAVSPHDPDVALAGTQRHGVHRSTDGGETWHATGRLDRPIKALAVSPHDPDTVYAGTKPAMVYRSRDGGAAWAPLEGFDEIRGRRLWFSPAEPPFYEAYVQALACSPTEPDVLLAGVEFGAVVRSDDGGRTWSGHRPGALRDCHTLAFHATDGRRVYQGGVGLPRRAAATSHDAGDHWQRPGVGLDRGYGWAVAADPADPSVWYVSASTGAAAAHGRRDARAMVFRTEVGGPWRAIEGLDQPLRSMPYGLVTDPAAPDHLYVGLADGTVWHSSDRGRTAERLPVELGAIERSLVAIPAWSAPR